MDADEQGDAKPSEPDETEEKFVMGTPWDVHAVPAEALMGYLNFLNKIGYTPVSIFPWAEGEGRSGVMVVARMVPLVAPARFH